MASGAPRAARYLTEGAWVVLVYMDKTALERTANQLVRQFAADVVRQVIMDVTNEDAAAAAYAQAAIENGGVDILISNAGIAASAPVEETSLALWNKNMDILSKGCFLVSREALRLMRAQGMEGAIVFIASKNGLAASPNASAYCTAKAAEIHLARCLGLDFFDAPISRTTAWVIGTRNMQKALLRALLQPMGLLRRAEDDLD